MSLYESCTTCHVPLTVMVSVGCRSDFLVGDRGFDLRLEQQSESYEKRSSAFVIFMCKWLDFEVFSDKDNKPCTHATSLRQAYNSFTIVVCVRENVVVLKHILKHCDNCKSCRRPVVRLSHAPKSHRVNRSLETPHTVRKEKGNEFPQFNLVLWFILSRKYSSPGSDTSNLL